MDDNKSPLTPPTSTLPIEPPPAPPLDLSTPMPKPISHAPSLETSPTQKLETPLQPPVEHDITSPTSLPPAQTIPAPESNATPADSSVSPQAPSPIPSMPSASSIPPMPSLDSLATAPSPLSNPAPTPVAAPIPNSVIDVSAPATTPSTPPAATELTSNVDSAAPAPAAPTSPVETKPLDSTQPKKSKALVFVVIILALVALTLGSLVVWSAMQPKTSSIEESMIPPVVPENEAVGEITEEEVIVEQPDETADWKSYSNNVLSFKYPNGWGTLEIGDNNESLMVAPQEKIDQVDAIEGGFGGGPFLVITVNRSNQDFVIDSDEFQKVTQKPIEIGNTEATEYTIDIIKTSPLGEPGKTIRYVVFEKDGETFSLNLLDEKYSQEFDQILSTLSFDSTASSTTPGAALQGSCTQDDMTYADGDEVPAPDSCNSCSCENGQIACTAMACEE